MVKQLYLLREEKEHNLKGGKYNKMEAKRGTKTLLDLDEKELKAKLKTVHQVLDPIDWSLLESVKIAVAKAERVGHIGIHLHVA